MVPDTAGMWMPGQLGQQEALLRSLGLNINVREISHMDEGLLQAIVSLGGCSGSFISASGLIITNHHCVQAMLSYLSSEENKRLKAIHGEETTHQVDYFRDGFIAHSQNEERSVGPAQKVFITTKIEEVTDQILAGIEEITDFEERSRTIESRIKRMVAEREDGRPAHRVEVKPFFRNAKYFLIEKLELRDVRLVFAPPGTVGYFGGDRDNWHWPRGTGDFSLIRAYVGPDGASQGYAENNVPYSPGKFLKVSKAGVRPGSLSLVFGYPGQTTRASTASEVETQMNTTMPATIHFLQTLIDSLKALGRKSHDLHIQTESMIFSASNGLKKNDEALKSLKELDYVTLRKTLETEILAWVNADPARAARYKNAQGLTPIDEIREFRERTRARQGNIVTLSRMLRFSALTDSAHNILRMAEERQKPDAERNPGFQERLWAIIEGNERQKQSGYSRAVNIEAFVVSVNAAVKEAKDAVTEKVTSGSTPAGSHASLADVPSYLHPFLNEKLETQRDRVEALFEETELEDVEKRLALFRSATPEELRRTSDPLLIWYRDFALPAVHDNERFAHEVLGEITPIERRYIAMMEEYLAAQGKLLAPDANSTLRGTIGVVAGYYSERRKRHLPPQTNFEMIVHKMERWEHEDPTFRIPQAVREIIYRLRTTWEGVFPVLGDEAYGSLPVNFLSSVDTTGGNSGSATLDENGALTGLLFDGSDDTLYSDHLHDEHVRSIHLDIRYFLAYLALGVGKPAHRILKELVVTPGGCEELLDEALTARPQEKI